MDKETLATKCGRWLGTLTACCLATCVAAVVVALTVKFIMWLM